MGYQRKTDEGDVCKGDILTYNTKNNYIYSESALVAAVGVEDIVIVQTKDAILVSKNLMSGCKKIVEMLKAQERTEYIVHREVFRPWGKFDSIDQGERYKVKKIIVKPEKGFPCVCIIIVQNTGLYFLVRLKSPR